MANASASPNYLPFDSTAGILRQVVSDIMAPGDLFLSWAPTFFDASTTVTAIILAKLIVVPVRTFKRIFRAYYAEFFAVPTLALGESRQSVPNLHTAPTRVEAASTPSDTKITSSPRGPLVFATMKV